MKWQLVSWSVQVWIILATILLPWPACKQVQHVQQQASQSIRVAAGQGLSVSSELLGAGEAATATQLELFEDSLAIALTGGRGRGGRGGSGNLGAAAFSDVERLRQLQRGIQYLAGSHRVYPSCEFNNSKKPGDFKRKTFCNNFIPRKPRDQQFCATCVSQSVATAMQIAVAAALEEDVSKKEWEVNAASLYYCTDGGRSCSTGYDIQENLYDVIDRMPELIRPSTCLRNVPELTNTAAEPSVLSWLPFCNKAKQAATRCPGTKEKPWLNCSYTSLSTFWEIQRHIRNHGAVITRITIYDDFDVQFGPTARLKAGERLQPYRFNKTAKPLYGHAALIVGYDNDDYTWTLLNSWGSGNISSNSRSKGITADGLFKIQMGLAGVGTPDNTYGVTCGPQPGSKSDRYGVKKFYGYKTKKLVSLWDPAKDGKDLLHATCYKYNFTKDDTVASVVDAFGLDIQGFVQDQLVLLPAQRAEDWGYQNISYKLSGQPTTEELDKILSSASQVLGNAPTFKPYMQCLHYDRTGKLSNTTCDVTTGATECNKLGNGTVGCTVYYSAEKVPLNLLQYKSVRVCNVTYPNLAAPKHSQMRALLKLGVDAAAYQTCSRSADVCADRRLCVGCNAQGYVTYIWSGVFDEFVAEYVNAAYDLAAPLPLASFSPDVLHALLTLTKLRAISVQVENGTLPLELSALTSLTHLLITYSCLSGPLPVDWRWPKLSTLLLGAYTANDMYIRLEPHCGITGPLPALWPAHMPKLRNLWLMNNKLSGSMTPAFASSRNSYHVRLDSNSFSGSIPQAYSNWSVSLLELQQNQLSGRLPAFTGASGQRSVLQGSLEKLNISSNQLTGELPSSWSLFDVLMELDVGFNQLQRQVPLTWSQFPTLYVLNLQGNPGLIGCVPVLQHQLDPNTAGTGITGRCNNIQRKEVESKQRQALNMLPRLCIPRVPSWRDEVTAALDSYLTMEAMYGYPKQAKTTLLFPSTATYGDNTADWFDLTLEGIDGAIYLTEININTAAVNMTVLLQLLPQLPRLSRFKSNGLFIDATKPLMQLPPNLPRVAPSSLKVFVIEGDYITGSLPGAWASWATVQELTIKNNRLLTGSLPDWSNMASLKSLDLGSNGLSGTFPEAYGTATWSKQLELLDLRNNAGLYGPIPGVWSSMMAEVELMGTSVSGCIPDQLVNQIDLGNDDPLPVCSAADNNPELAGLSAVLEIFEGSGLDFSSWVKPADDPGGVPVPDAPPAPPPYYCRDWQGVACDAANRVATLDLSSLIPPGLSPQITPFNQTCVELIANLTGLQVLNLSGCNVQGRLPDNMPLLANLKHLNLSSNPSLASPLPSSWASLSNLETLDVSGCSITGSIPSTYGALQRLRELHAAGNVGINGQLPSTFGLLPNLQVLDVSNASLTGQLPVAWFDGSARRAAARAFKGTVASSAVIGPTGLHVLRLSGNQLSGSISDAIDLLAQLRVLDLSGNRLQGLVPAKMATLMQLQELKLARNQLQGTLLQSFARLAKLQLLDLSQNNITGTLPELWVGLTELRHMTLASNLLSGTFPSVWGSMSTAATHKLALIDLRDNPCMDMDQLEASINASGIERSGRVEVLRGAVPGQSKTCQGLK